MVGYQVGADRTNGGREWKGEFGEVLAFNAKLSDSDRKKVQTYLSQKWNISIPSQSTAYVSSAKDSSGNNYNGILRRKFAPSTLSDLDLWLDAGDTSTLSHSSNAVTQWDDKSGNNYHAGALSNEAPTTGASTMNGKNVLTWANGKRMKRSTPTSANWQDVYVVAKWTGGSTFTNHNGLSQEVI